MTGTPMKTKAFPNKMLYKRFLFYFTRNNAENIFKNVLR